MTCLFSFCLVRIFPTKNVINQISIGFAHSIPFHVIVSYLEYVFLYFYLIYTLIFFINILFIIFFLHIFYISITTPTQTPSFFTFRYSHNCSSFLSFISSQWPSLLMLDFCGNVRRRLYLGRLFTWAVFYGTPQSILLLNIISSLRYILISTTFQQRNSRRLLLVLFSTSL